MKELLKSHRLIWMIVLVVSLMGCQKSSEEEPQTPPDTITTNSSEKININYQEGHDRFRVWASGPWTAICDQPWMTLSKDEAGEWLEMTWQKNEDYKERTATITITCGTATKKIPVTQQGAHIVAEVVSTHFQIGNLVNNEVDSIGVEFNYPVKQVGSKSFDGLAYNDLEARFSEDRKTVWVAFPYKNLGRTVNCKFDVLFDFGVRAMSFDVNFYDQFIPLEGYGITSTLFSEDGQTMWASTPETKKIIEMSLPDGAILREVELPFNPGHICLNPYNKQLYVLPENGGNHYKYSNTICRVDPEKGVITNTVTIDPSEKAHPQYPAIYPQDLQFTKDGVGILVLKEWGASGLETRFVDSSKDDEVTFYDMDELPEWGERLEHLYQNHDKSRVYATTYYAHFNHLYYIEGNKKELKMYHLSAHFDSDKYYAGGNMVKMAFSPFRDQFAITTAPACLCMVTLGNPVEYSDPFTDYETRSSYLAWNEAYPDRSLVYMYNDMDKYLFLFDMDEEELIYVVGFTRSEAKTIHYLKSSNMLLVQTLNGFYLFDTSRMKISK